MGGFDDVMRAEIQALYKRSLAPHLEDKPDLLAQLVDCLNRAEKLATESPKDQAFLRLLRDGINGLKGR